MLSSLRTAVKFDHNGKIKFCSLTLISYCTIIRQLIKYLFLTEKAFIHSSSRLSAANALSATALVSQILGIKTQVSLVR